MAEYDVKDGVGIIPEGITVIEKEAFGNTFPGLTYDQLIRITIPNHVTKIDTCAFYNCINLEYVFIPDSVTEIGDVAFYGCKKLKEIVIPNSVTKIEEGTFANCSALASITIPDSVTEIVVHAFAGCSNVKKIIVSGHNKVYDSRNNCNAIIETATNRMIVACETTIIPDSVTEIGDYAFEGCKSLTSINIPNSVTKIGKYAFQGCVGLTSINIPPSVTVIEEGTFIGCSRLAKVILPNSLTKILGNMTLRRIWRYDYDIRPFGAFTDCTSLTDIVIPNSVVEIGDFAFFGCNGLISLTIPDSLATIGIGSFGECNNLKTVYVSGKMTDFIKSNFSEIITPIMNSVPHKHNAIGALDGSVKPTVCSRPDIVEIPEEERESS